MGAIRHSSRGKFLGNAGILLLLRDGPLLPNGPNLQNWKLYLGVSRAELKLKVIDLFHGGDSFFFLNGVSRVKVEDRRARGHERVDRNFY